MPDQTQSLMSQRSRLRASYDNFIGGKWQAPAKGRYFVNSSPIDGMKLCDVARSDAEDVERALVDIVAQFGARSTDEAVLFVGELKKKGRFQLDVY